MAKHYTFDPKTHTFIARDQTKEERERFEGAMKGFRRKSSSVKVGSLGRMHTVGDVFSGLTGEKFLKELLSMSKPKREK